MHRRGRSSRRGFVLFAALGLLTVLGIMLYALHFFERQQNLQAHRLYFGEVAQHLADSCLELLGRSVRRHAYAAPGQALNLRYPLDIQGFFLFFMQDSDTLQARFDRLSTGDQHAFLQQLFGEHYRYPLDVLEDEYPGADLDVKLAIEANPLFPRDAYVKDRVEKTVNLTLRATATYRGVTRRGDMTLALKVAHPMPPGSCKFTLFAHDASGENFNAYQNLADGRPAPDSAARPFVLYNTPPNVRSDNDLNSANKVAIDASRPFEQVPEVRKVLARRGYVYLGTGTGNASELVLRQTAGARLADDGSLLASPYGEFFHLYDPVHDGAYPAYYRLRGAHAPPFFQRLAPAWSGLSDEVYPYINFLYWGFHEPDPAVPGDRGLKDGVLNTDIDSRGEASSLLHLFGSADNPSRTLVFGPVKYEYIRFGFASADRQGTADDSESEDESIQKGRLASTPMASQVYIPNRDGIVATLRHVPSEAEFDAEMARESSGAPFEFLAKLDPLLSTPAIEVANLNYRVTGADGTDYVLDPGKEIFSLDPSTFNYRNMFEGRYDDLSPDERGYDWYQSQVRAMPYGELIDYMYYGRVIPPDQHANFPGNGPTLTESPDFYESGRDVKLSFSDPLHAYLDQTDYFHGPLDSLLDPAGRASPAAAMLDARVSVSLPDGKSFLDRYLVPPLNPGDLPELACPDCVRIESGDLDLPRCLATASGLVVVADGSIRSHGVDTATGNVAPSFVSLSGDIVLDANRKHAACWLACGGRIERSGDGPLWLRYSLAAHRLPAESIAQGGAIFYDSNVDPTGDNSTDPARWSYIDYYVMSVSDCAVAWKRRAAE